MESEEGGAAAPEVSPPLEGGGCTAEDQVMSEVHLGCPPDHSGPHISHFTISLPHRVLESGGSGPIPRRTVGNNREERIEDSLNSMRGKVCEVDEDGDLILTRRHHTTKDSFVVIIQHKITSSIPRVGLQVWRAELVLADFVLDMMYKSSNFDGVVALELGAGTGLVGMLLARAAKTVFITDCGDEVLENCAKNIDLNAEIFKHKASVYVRELDWNRPWPPEVIINSPSPESYGWSISEVEEIQRASLLFAADVIYSDDLTDAFFSVLEVIMSNNPGKVLYLALEKRYNFSIDDLDVVANGYSHFRSYFKHEEEEDDLETEFSQRFIGKLIDLEEIPQYVQEYDRGNDVEIWQIRYVKVLEP